MLQPMSARVFWTFGREVLLEAAQCKDLLHQVLISTEVPGARERECLLRSMQDVSATPWHMNAPSATSPGDRRPDGGRGPPAHQGGA